MSMRSLFVIPDLLLWKANQTTVIVVTSEIAPQHVDADFLIRF